MGVSVDTGGKGGKKSVNADLNLVPYIDLLTCMVAFLLITAVWSQLARLEAHQKGQGQAGEETPPEKIVKLVVIVNSEGFNLVAGDDQQPILKRGDQYDFEKLSSELKKIKFGTLRGSRDPDRSHRAAKPRCARDAGTRTQEPNSGGNHGCSC